MKRILALALVATLAACSGGTGGTGGSGGGTTGDGGTAGGSGGGSGGGTGGGSAGGTGGGTAGGSGGGSGGGTAGGTGGTGGGTAGGAGGGTAGGSGGGSAGGAGGGTAGGAGGGTAGGAGGGSGGSGGTCALDTPAQCTNNTFCYSTTTSAGGMGSCFGGCDVVTQNCTPTNTQCNYGPDAGRDCFPNGTLAEGEACGAAIAMGCIAGTTCVGLPSADGGSPTSCAKFCRTSSQCLGGKVCTIQLQIPGTTERPQVCNAPPATCSILAQNCAATTDGCYPASATTSGCYPAGNVAAGGTCASGNACVKGSLCLTASSGNTCRAVCNTDGGSPPCGTGTTCTPLTFGQGVGACQ